MLNGQAEPSSQLGGLERAGAAREAQGQVEENGSCADKEGSRMEWRDVLDVHTCHICGFTAGDVRGLSVHLSSAHPSTVYPRPANHARSDGPVQRQEEEAKRQLSSFMEKKDLKNNSGLDAAMEVSGVCTRRLSAHRLLCYTLLYQPLSSKKHPCSVLSILTIWCALLRLKGYHYHVLHGSIDFH